MKLPHGPDGVSSEWLSWALANGPADLDPQSCAVADVSPVLLTRQGAYGQIARLFVEYKHDGSAGPGTLIGKFSSPNATMRRRENTQAAYEREVRFYLELAPTVGVPVPACFFAAIDPPTGWHVILMEDLAPAAPQPGPISAADARTAVELIARLHVRFWHEPQLAPIDWVPAPTPPPDEELDREHRSFWAQFQDRVETISATVRQIGDELGPRIGTLLRHLARPGPKTIVHGDFGPGNLLYQEDADPPLFIVDWQFARQGVGLSDVAWLLTQHVEPDERRAIEVEIIRRYVRFVAESGIADYSIEDAMRDYRASILSRFRTVITSVVALPFSEEMKNRLVNERFPRFSDALVDNHCLEQLREL